MLVVIGLKELISPADRVTENVIAQMDVFKVRFI